MRSWEVPLTGLRLTVSVDDAGGGWASAGCRRQWAGDREVKWEAGNPSYAGSSPARPSIFRLVNTTGRCPLTGQSLRSLPLQWRAGRCGSRWLLYAVADISLLTCRGAIHSAVAPRARGSAPLPRC